MDELESVFDETGSVLDGGVTSVFDLAGRDDYMGMLDLVAEAKCMQADKYEKDFNEPWPGPRPKKCQATE